MNQKYVSGVADAPSWRDRARLIDFFKRVFAIIAGLAITEACKRLLPARPAFEPPDPAFWMFAALLITIIPIFHGGDRSLDVRHLDQPVKTRGDRLKFLWDVYALLATGLLLVCAADAIPDVATIAKHEPSWSYAAAAADFYRWLGLFFLFNVVVLVVDWATSPVRDRLRSYFLWIPINLGMSIVCLGVNQLFMSYGDACLSWLPFAFFALALLRTGADYWFSDASFMFP